MGDTIIYNPCESSRLSSTAPPGSSLLLGAHLRTVYTVFFFFFQAEDGIRDYKVTGVQTCALPICHIKRLRKVVAVAGDAHRVVNRRQMPRLELKIQYRSNDLHNASDLLLCHSVQIGRASCRERV